MAETFSREDVDRIVAKALKEQAETLTLDNLKAELSRVWKAIEEANHFKKDFGKKFEELNSLVRSHISLAMHPGAAEAFLQRDQDAERIIKAFQIEELTPDQQAAFPKIVKSFVDGEQRKVQLVEQRQRWWRTTEARIGLIAGALLAYQPLKDIVGSVGKTALQLLHQALR